MESERREVEHRGREGSEAIWLDRGHVVGLMIGDPVSIKPPKTTKFSEDYITLTKDRKETKMRGEGLKEFWYQIPVWRRCFPYTIKQVSDTISLSENSIEF